MIPEEYIPAVFLPPPSLIINEIFLSSEAEVITEPLLLVIKKAPFPESPNLTIASTVLHSQQ